MRRMRRLAACACARPPFVLLLFLLVIGPGCTQPGALPPQPGVLDYRAPLRVALPLGEVDVAGGNLVVRRTDLSLDTWLGTVEIGAVYNSSTRAWTWSFDMRYDGVTFTDATGAVHVVDGLAPGAAVPGTHWVKVDATRMRTKGGLVHVFDPIDHGLRSASWGGLPDARLVYDVAIVSGSVRPVRLWQCDDANACRFVVDFQYDENGCVIRIGDRAGRVALFENDEACRTTTARDGLDVEEGWPGWRYAYRDGLLHAATSSEGERTTYAYLDGHLSNARRVGDRVRTTHLHYMAMDASGLYTTFVRDPRDGVTTYTYDGEGRLVRQVDAVSDVRTMQWSGRRPVRFVDPAGLVTTWQYEDDDPVLVVLPSGNHVTIEYAPDAHDRRRPLERPLLRRSDDLGPIEERTYDALGRLVRIENGAGEVTAFDYGHYGLLRSIRLPDGTFTEYADFGEHGHPSRAMRSTYVDHRQYDAVGNRIEGADLHGALSPGRPGIRRLGFDADRNLRSVELVPSGELGEPPGTVHLLGIERRSDGRIRRILRPYGGDEERIYDALGDLVERRERVDGVWRSTHFEHARDGRLRAVSLPNGMRREYDHDAIGRVVQTRLVEHGAVVQTEVVAHAAGRPSARLDSVHGQPEQYAYDFAGRLERIVHPAGEVTELAYDVRSREIRRVLRIGLGAPPLRTLERGWDAADREVTLHDDGDTVLDRTYEGGRLTAVRYGNGVERRTEYDPDFGLPTRTITEHAPTGTFVEETRLSWESCHGEGLCLTSRNEVAGDGAGLAAGRVYEGYRLGPLPVDPVPEGVPGLRVEAFVEDDLADLLGYTAPTYAFDALGNWLGVTESGVPRRAFTFNDEHNRLLAAEGDDPHTYAWDEAGFAIERDGEALEWSPNGRPTSIGTAVSMSWEVRGRPVSSTIDGVTTRALFGGAVVANAYGIPLRLDLGGLSIDLTSGERLYRHTDFRGNVQLVTDDAGVGVLQRAYSPFGVAQRRGDHDDDRSFAGGREIGDLLMLGARLYDPAIGRFLSPDPVEHLVNAFAYTLGNPVFLWDPGGTFSFEALANDPAFVRDLAESFQDVGIVFVAAGIATGSPGLVGAGLVLNVSSVALKARARALEAPPAFHGPSGADPGHPTNVAEPSITEASDVGALGCAPTAFASRRDVAWTSFALAAVQLGVALIALRGRRSWG